MVNLDAGSQVQGSKEQQQAAKSSRRGAKKHRSDRAERDLVSGGAAPDQAGKQHPATVSKANGFASPDLPGSADTVARPAGSKAAAGGRAAADKAPIANGSHPSLANALTATEELPRAGSMPPTRKQQGSQQQQKGQEQRSGAAGQGGKGSSSSMGGSTGPPASAQAGVPPQQGSGSQARSLRSGRTGSSGSIEASFPAANNQPSRLGGQQQQQQRQGSDASTNSTGQHQQSQAAATAHALSYVAAAQRRPAVASASSSSASTGQAGRQPRQPAPVPVQGSAAAPAKEPFPPLPSPGTPKSNPSNPDYSWGGSGNSSQANTTGGWNASSSRPWGAPAKTDAGASKPIADAPAAPSRQPPAESADKGQASTLKADGGSDSSSTGPAGPAAVPAPNKVDAASSNGNRAASGPTSSSRVTSGGGGGRGGGGSNIRRGSYGNGGPASAQWAPKPQPAQQQQHEQQSYDPWDAKAAGYHEDLLGKPAVAKATAAHASQGPHASGGFETQQQASAVPDSYSDSSKAEAVSVAAAAAAATSAPAAVPAPAAAPAFEHAANKVPSRVDDQQLPRASSASVAADAPAAAPQQAPTAGAAGSTQAADTHGTAEQRSSAFGDHSNKGSSSSSQEGNGAGLAATSMPAVASKAAVQQQQAQQQVQQMLQQQVQKPVVNLPSSQAVNMAAVATHNYSHYEIYSTPAAGLGAPEAAFAAAAVAPHAMAYGAYPLRQLPAPGQVQGTLEFGHISSSSISTGPTSSSSRMEPAPAPASAAAYQRYNMPGNQGPLGYGVSLGPSSTGSTSSHSSNTAGPRSAMGMRRHLSADAPPFELSNRTSSSGGAAGPGAAAAGGSSGMQAGSSEPAGAVAASDGPLPSTTSSASRSSSSGKAQATAGNGSNAPGAAAGAAGSSGPKQRLSQKLHELAKLAEADEQKQEADKAEQDRQLKALQQQLDSERAARMAAEEQASDLDRELDISRKKVKDLEQQLASVDSDRAASAAEAAAAHQHADSLQHELDDMRLQLGNMTASLHNLQDINHSLERDNQDLIQQMRTQEAHAANAAARVAAAAVAAASSHAAAAAVPDASMQQQQQPRSSAAPLPATTASDPRSGGTGRLPPPGFGPIPPALPRQQLQEQQPSQPGISSQLGLSAAAAGAPAEVGMLAQGQQGAVRHMKNEHELVSTMLSLLSPDPEGAVLWSDAEVAAVNAQLVPLTWDEHYSSSFGSMTQFMSARPAVFVVRADGAFYKQPHAEQLVREKAAEDEKKAAAVAGAGPSASADSSAAGPAADAGATTSSSAGFLPLEPLQQQQQAIINAGSYPGATASAECGWPVQYPHPQQSLLSSGGPPSGSGMHVPMHVSMPMVLHGMGGPGPAPVGGHMAPMSMGVPFYPHPGLVMPHTMPMSMSMVAPSVPFSHATAPGQMADRW